ncbi:MAG: aminoacyl--tRNA ligase-related protein, partial [Candidatus Ranarchaeia archaeon]
MQRKTREKWRRFMEWFRNILSEAEILDYRYPIKGFGVWMPYGFQIRKAVIETIRKVHDQNGHQEALFPLLVPDYIFQKEALHVKGFEDEVFWVTHGGLTPLDVKLALRPTSETAIYPMYKLWIRSHSDLPLRLYQIVNVFRHETKATRPMIRVREITTFQEAHTVHASKEDLASQIQSAMQIYSKIFDLLGIPYLISKRPEWDKFAGADYSNAFDCIMPDGKTLQIGTVHNLGQNFSKTFDITFEAEDGSTRLAY